MLENEKMGLTSLDEEYLNQIDKESSNWDLYKSPKKRDKIIKTRAKIIKMYNIFLINKNKKLLIKFKINSSARLKHNYYEDLGSVKNAIRFVNSYNNKNIKNLLILYSKLNLKKFKDIKNNNYLVSFTKHLIIIIDVRNLKPRIFVINNNKCIFSLTSGIIFKKMQMKEKKLKKSEKMFNVMVKTTITNIKKRINCNKFIINLVGTKYNLINSVIYIRKNFLKDNITFLYSPSINHNNLKVKKIKSIKKRLKKRFIRFK